MRDKIVVYGMGRIFRKYEYLINKSDVVCYVDNNASESLCSGKVIVKPEQLNEFDYDYIVVFSLKYYNEIAYELIWTYGVNINKIVLFQWYYNLRYNTINLYSEFLKLIEKTGVRSILDIDNCLHSLGLWGISKKKNIKIDFIEYYDEFSGEFDCGLINSSDKKYDIAILNGTDFCEDEIPVIVNRVLEKSKTILIYIKNCRLIKNSGYKVVNIQGYLFLYVLSENKTTKIYQVSHKSFVKYNDDIYYELGVGNYTKDGILTDKTGDSIAYLNDKINEITGLYTIWKNDNSDIIGLNHYRRCFKSILNQQYGAISELEINLFLDKYDIIVAQPTGPVYCSEKESLRSTIDEEAFDRCWNVINDYFNMQSGKEQKVFDYFFSNQFMFPCNMFITSKKIINEYCQWLMPIVFYLVDNVEFDERWDMYSSRVIGFFSERLLTIWLYMSDYSFVDIPIQFIGEAGVYGK